MKRSKWLLSVILPYIFGRHLVQYLTVHPLKMGQYLFTASMACFSSVLTLALGFSGAKRLLTLPMSIASALYGYKAMTRAFLSRDDPRPIPDITREKRDPGLGHTAVVYFTHGEPETYDPIGWINQFNEFDEQGIPFVPLLIRPIFIYQLRKKYLQVGKSHHREMHRQMLKSLEQAYRAQGDSTTRFYLSFLDDNPRPDAAVIQALNEGASRIIVSRVFANIGETPKDKVGVLLVGHGQPDEWDVEWPSETEQELGFRRDVLRLFEQDGYKRENLSLAWIEFKEPKPAPKVEEFSRNGVEKVVYFSAAISADAIHSQNTTCPT